VEHAPPGGPNPVIDHPASGSCGQELPRRDDVGLASGELSKVNVDFTPL
jgi:hypothetical protein